MIVAVEAGAHGKEVAEGDGGFAWVWRGVTCVGHVGQDRLVCAGERAAIDCYAGEGANDGFGGGAEFMLALNVVSVEVFFEHEMAELVEEDAVHILVGAVGIPRTIAFAVAVPRSEWTMSPMAMPSCRSVGIW